MCCELRATNGELSLDSSRPSPLPHPHPPRLPLELWSPHLEHKTIQPVEEWEGKNKARAAETQPSSYLEVPFYIDQEAVASICCLLLRSSAPRTLRTPRTARTRAPSDFPPLTTTSGGRKNLGPNLSLYTRFVYMMLDLMIT